MKFLMIGTWDPAAPEIPRLLPAEQQRTRELGQEGFVEQLLLRADGRGGYLTLNAESAAAAHELLGTFPFMQHGIMSAQLVELKD